MPEAKLPENDLLKILKIVSGQFLAALLEYNGE